MEPRTFRTLDDLDGGQATVTEVTNRSIDAAAEHIAVDHVDGEHRLVATKDFGIGDHILQLEGEIVGIPSKFSVQVGPDQHLDLPAEARAAQPMDRYRWRFLNHSCAPNAAFDARRLVAIRAIKASEQITFDYNTTEYDLSSPFECHCGSDDCVGVVRGSRWQHGQARAEG
jgi:hypothetical protein